MSHTYDTMQEPHFTKEQVAVAQRIKALLMFADGANGRRPDEDIHNKVIAYVFNNMERRYVVQAIIERGITDYDEVLAAVAEADLHHASLHNGML